MRFVTRLPRLLPPPGTGGGGGAVLIKGPSLVDCDGANWEGGTMWEGRKEGRGMQPCLGRCGTPAQPAPAPLKRAGGAAGGGGVHSYDARAGSVYFRAPLLPPTIPLPPRAPSQRF